jgi:hypothetical protein
MSPVNDFFGPLIAKALYPFVAAKALGIVYGGQEVGPFWHERSLLVVAMLTLFIMPCTCYAHTQSTLPCMVAM